MGLYVIATTNGDVQSSREDQEVRFNESHGGWIGEFQGERVESVFLDEGSACINILAKFKSKHPDIVFYPTEDAILFGVEESRYD